MTSRVFDVPGISCDHCKRAIEEAVSEVDSVVVTVDRRVVEVAGVASDDAVIAAIQLAGYEVAQGS
jgi:copper chaperone